MRANVILITEISIVISKCRTTTGNANNAVILIIVLNQLRHYQINLAQRCSRTMSIEIQSFIEGNSEL